MAWSTPSKSVNVDSDLTENDDEIEGVKGAVDKFFSYATVHGFSHVWGEKGFFRRFLWMALCLILTGYAVYQIAIVMADYGTYPKKIAKDVKEDRKMIFPAVTICTLSKLPRVKELEDHKKWGAFILMESAFNQTKCNVSKTTTASTDTSNRRKRSINHHPGSRDSNPMEYFEHIYNLGTIPGRLLRSLEKQMREAETSREERNRWKLHFSKEETNSTIRRKRSTDCDGIYCYTGENECLPKSSICDGEFNCMYEEDEMNCTSCSNGAFLCGEGKCIPGRWVCDDYTDCSEGEDEMVCFAKNATDTYECPVGNFTCDDGSCLSSIFICDGEKDCLQGEDEKSCTICSGSSFLCQDYDETCVGSHQVCNGISNCPSGSDELNCTSIYQRCPNTYYQCLNGTCINPRFLCDNHYDCIGGEDETNCSMTVDYLNVHYTRLVCSKYYSNIYKLVYDLDITTTFGSNCSLTTGTTDFTEIASFSPMCGIGFVCDHFGCYDTNLHYYKEYLPREGVMCAKCNGVRESCWAQFWIYEWQQGILSPESLKVMLSKTGTDFEDITFLFQPNETEALQYAIAPDDVIYSCRFNGGTCDSGHFKQWISDEYGICYTFNSGDDYKFKTSKDWPYSTKTAGPGNGLEVTLNIRTSLAVLSPEVGAKVIIHDPGFIPVPKDEGFTIGPGTSSVRVSRTYNEHLDLPHGNCSTIYNRPMPFQTYSRSVCLAVCLEAQIRMECNCREGISPIYDSLPNKPETRCNNFDIPLAICTHVVKRKFTDGVISCGCFQPCKEMVYEPRVTTSKLNDHYFKLLHEQRKAVSSLCNEGTELLTLDVYVDSMFYGIMKEEAAYSFDTLISNIGGSLGLFIGVSIVSIAELIEFIADMCLASFKKKSKKNSKSNQVFFIKGQAPVDWYIDDNSTNSKVTVRTLEELRSRMNKEKEIDLATLKQEMIIEKEVDLMTLKQELDHRYKQLELEISLLKEKPQITEREMDAIVDKSIARVSGGTQGEDRNSTPSQQMIQQAFNKLFLDNQR